MQKNIYTIGKQILKIKWKCRISRIVKITLKKKNKVRRLKLPDFKTYHRAAVVKTAWHLPYGQTTKSMEQNIQKQMCTSKGSFTEVIQQEKLFVCNNQGCNSENPCEVNGPLLLPYSTHTNELKMGHRPKCEESRKSLSLWLGKDLVIGCKSVKYQREK